MKFKTSGCGGRGARVEKSLRVSFRLASPTFASSLFNPSLTGRSSLRRRFLGDIIFKPPAWPQFDTAAPFEFRIQSANGPDSYPDFREIKGASKIDSRPGGYFHPRVRGLDTRVRHTCSRGGVAARWLREIFLSSVFFFFFFSFHPASIHHPSSR